MTEGQPLTAAEFGQLLAGYEHTAFRLERQRRYSEPLEPTDGLSGWGYDLLRLATVAAVVALLWVMCAVMAQ